ncbi:HEAT repeat domain-containing protein [Allosphingosinicella deserti]|uniref:HEAT repeat domain-containing protein n=1 Tax=Allosphingosinicella deserti TaxID=2116704 RepID=A0A2P7QRD2_9SPHN|nr:HEAT repeat domain-containing protein [Sphingomonas deserti]PSJ40504.1 hypothetical protein C7I55_09220 [Sphingomonas deserti]
MLNSIALQARAIASRPDFTFGDYAELFADLDATVVSEMFGTFLRDILAAPADGEQIYHDELHLASEGDFNLTLKLTGRGRTTELTASEFDMLAINIGDRSVTHDLYRTDIAPEALHRRPAGLAAPEPVAISPYGIGNYRAYTEIADLSGADREVPLLVVHSRARGETTWVFDRRTGAPIGLTDNHLQSSRLRIAARIMGALPGDGSTADVLERLARSDQTHFVRWEAAESIWKIDPVRGTALLRDHLAQDPHPAIREAARKTLANIAAAAGGS